MLRSLFLCATFLLAVSPSPTTTFAPSSALEDLLAGVPDTADIREQPVSYVDYRAVEQARPGAAQPTSYADLETLRGADDPSAKLWLAAYQGIRSGSGDLLRYLTVGGPVWPTLVGFDFFDVDREITFGAPPSDGLLLGGRFDPSAIANAFAARDYSATDVGGRTLLCGPDGCDSGTAAHLDQRNPQNPFGGDLGRLEPLAVSSTILESSASGDTLRAMLDAESGATLSLGADPDYGAAAEALAADGSVIQATLVPADLVSADLPGLVLRGGDAAKRALEKFAATFEPIPPYQLLAFADGATPTEQVVRVGLVYEDATDAQQAIDVLPGRLDSVPSLVANAPLRQLLDDLGVTSVEGQVVPSSDGTKSVAVITLRAPLASAQPDAGTSLLTSSSLVYALLANMLLARDSLWFALTLPAVN